MQPINTGLSQAWEWHQEKSSKAEYELLAGDHLLATLKRKSIWGSLATGTTADGEWTFKRVGFWHPRVTVRVAGSDEDLAVFEPRWTGNGTLTFADQTQYHWKSANFWWTKWEWLDAREQSLFHFEMTKNFLKQEAKVEVLSGAIPQAHRSILPLLGWYLILLSMSDLAGSTAATTAATSVAISS